MVIEYLDSKRHFNQPYLQAFADLLAQKYRQEHFDIIISTDDNALDFMLRYRDELFPATTMVFSGINKPDPNRTEGYAKVFGFTENLQVVETLDIALKLQPTARNVYFVADASKSSEAMLEKAKAAERNSGDNISFHYLVALTPEKLASELRKLQKNAIVIYLAYIRISEGRVISLKQSIDLVTENSAAPVYITWGFRPGQGVVGGRIVSGFIQGEVAAKLAMQILSDGETPPATQGLRGNDRRRWTGWRRDGHLQQPGSYIDGSEPAGDRRLGGDPPPEGRPRHPWHPGDCADGACHG